jgi:hypothetical protein
LEENKEGRKGRETRETMGRIEIRKGREKER